jgi:uncharacterized repeat protein (TIGR01451 family)
VGSALVLGVASSATATDALCIDECEPAVATLVIEKGVKGAWPGTPFTFQVTGGGNPLETVSIAETDGEHKKQIFVPAGLEITVTEAPKDGYEPLSAECEGPPEEPVPLINGDSSPSEDSFTPAPGETWTCSFENGELPTLEVEKFQMGGTPEAFDFELRRAGDEAGPTAFQLIGNTSFPFDETPFTTTLSAGAEYTVAELPKDGFTFASFGCWEETTYKDLFDYDSSTASVTIGGEGSAALAYGDKVQCTFDNGKNPQLIVKKTVTGAGAGDTTPFDFTLSTPAPERFKGETDEEYAERLAKWEAENPDIPFSLANGEDKTLPLLPSNRRIETFTVTELAPPVGYVFDTLTCTRTDPQGFESEYKGPTALTVPTDGPTATIARVSFGTVIECTYTNVKLPKLTVVKALTNGSGAGLTTPFPFTITGQPAFSLTGGQSDGPRTLPVGAYTVTEGALPAGFTFTGVSCSEPTNSNGQSVEVNLAAGDDVTCTFTNDQTPPPAVVTQVLRPRLAIVKTGPLRARGLQRLTYTIRVRDPGTAVAQNVVVTDVLPTGLSYVKASRKATVKGRTVSVAMGNLQPGASRTVKVTVRAAANIRGRKVNVAVARATDVSPVRDSARTLFTPLVRRVIPAVTG